MSQSIVVIAEHDAGQIAPASLEAINFALALQRLDPAPISVLILGQDVERLARVLASWGGQDVLAVEVEGLGAYSGEVYHQLLPDLLERLEARRVVIAATSQGQDFGPGLAVRLGAACLGGVRGLEAGPNGPSFVRETAGGKLLQGLEPRAASAVVLVQPGFFGRQAQAGGAPGQITRLSAQAGPKRGRELPTVAQTQAGSSLAEAEVIVAAGRGVGKPENIALIRQLAAQFPRSAVAGSRPVCDDGWLEYRCQVGVTGQTVSPKLYIACGISGASQHVAGMRGAGFVAAVNSDPQAAIFNEADVCVVEDLAVFLPELTAQLQKLKS